MSLWFSKNGANSQKYGFEEDYLNFRRGIWPKVKIAETCKFWGKPARLHPRCINGNVFFLELTINNPIPIPNAAKYAVYSWIKSLPA